MACGKPLIPVRLTSNSDQGANKMRPMIARSALALWLGLVCAYTCSAQTTLDGEWTGGLDSGTQWLPINVRFANENGGFRGSVDLPRFNLANQPLSRIKVEGRCVSFEWERGALGTGIFDGEFKEGGLV